MRTLLALVVFVTLIGMLAACRGQEAVPLDTSTPVPLSTPVMYKLAVDTYAPAGVWKSIDHTHPDVYMIVAAETQIPNAESDVHAVLTLKHNCDYLGYVLGVGPSIALKQGEYLEVGMRLTGEEEYKTTWWDLSDGQEPSNLWRLYDTAHGEQWPSGYPSASSEKPFWDSLLPGLYDGKDLHFTIDGHLSVTFDAAGFQEQWDSLEPSCFFRRIASISESGGRVSQEEYREWAMDMAERAPRLERAIALCDAEHDLMNDAAVIAAFERFADAERTTSQAAKRVLPAGYDARYDTVPDDVWAEMAPYAPEFMAAGTQYISALADAVLSAGCDL